MATSYVFRATGVELASDLYKNLIDKFLSGMKLNLTNTDEASIRPDNEVAFVKEELTGAISGNKMYGDMPGLQIEESLSEYQEESVLPEKTEKNEVNPLDGIEVVFFYMVNQDVVLGIVSHPNITRSIVRKRNFKTIEEIAEYILKNQNINYDKQDIVKLSKELIMLNSNGDETTLDKKAENALENINNGNINYVDYTKTEALRNISQSYKNIGLSGVMYDLAEKISLNKILFTEAPQNNACEAFMNFAGINEKSDNSEINAGFIRTFGAFSELLNILAILPLAANKPLQSGVKAVNNLCLSGKEISGTDLINTFYSAQEAVRKTGIGQFKNLHSVENTVAESNNQLSFIDTVQNNNTDKYLNNPFLENLRFLISFENAKNIIKEQIADKSENYGSNTEAENLIEHLNTLKNLSLRTVKDEEGNIEYLVKYIGKEFNFKTIGEAITASLSLMSKELDLKHSEVKSEVLSENSADNQDISTPANKSNFYTDIYSFEVGDRVTADGNSVRIDINKIKTLLFQGGVKFNNKCVGKILDNGVFLCDMSNEYLLENPSYNISGKKSQLVYTHDGNLKLEKTESLNDDGTHTSILRAYNNNEVWREFITTTLGNKVISASKKTEGNFYESSEYFYNNGVLAKTVQNSNQQDKFAKYPQATSVKKTTLLENNIYIYEYSYPKGSEYAKTLVFVDNETGEEAVIDVNNNGIATDNKGFPINISKMIQNLDTQTYGMPENTDFQNSSDKNFSKNSITVEIQENENYNEIKLYNENKDLLGEVHYTLSSEQDDICVFNIKTSSNDNDISSALLQEVLKTAEKHDKGVILTFQDGFNDINRKETPDLEFYYKMGFQADDAGTDKLIRKCLTKGLCVPAGLSQTVLLKHTGDITPSKPILTVTLQDICKDLEIFLNHDNYLINVEYKDLFKNIEKIDNENLNLHINNIKKCINSDIDGNSIKLAIDKGYFSSSKGAEAFEVFYNMFTNHETNSFSGSLNVIISHFDVRNFENAKKRGLIEKLNADNVDYINTLASYTDKQYNQRIKFANMGIEYISNNDDINRLAVKYVKNKTGNSYSSEEIEKILIQIKDPQKIAEIADKLIKADNYTVINLLKYTKNPKFVAENIDRLASLDAKLYTASRNIRILNNSELRLYEYEDICERLYPNEEIISILLDIDASGKYNEEQLYAIGSAIDNNNKTFVKKLALSDSATPNEVLKILNNTKFITILNEHTSELSAAQRLEAYNVLLSMPERLKSICKNCGLDINSKIKYLPEQLEPEYSGIETTEDNLKAFNRILSANNNKKMYSAFAKFDFSQYGKNGLPLRYTKEEFSRNIDEILSEFSEKEQSEILKHFGLTKGVMKDFDGIPNNKQFESKKGKLKKAAALVQTEIENFTVKNEFMIEESSVKKVLDGIIQGIPEFLMFVGKKQHGEHAYSVDIHTFKVLQSAINDPLYSELSENNKIALKLAILMHDFGKKGGISDKGHSYLSMKYASVILNKFNLPDDIKLKVLDTIKNHNWFADFNTGKLSADEISTICRNDEDFKILEIFAKADFSNVNPIFQYYKTGTENSDEFDRYMTKRFNKIKKLYKQ